MGHADRLVLVMLLLLALALRLRVGVNATYIIHPDEIWDYLEQGHRLAFGTGQLTWTYEHGLRSPFFPSLIGVAMRVGAWFSTTFDAKLNAVAVMMSVLSLPAVAVAYLWGRRAAGSLGGLISGTLAAVWYEFLYYAPHALSEVLAGDLLIVGIYLTIGITSPGRGRLLVAGMLLALAVYTRIQIAPGAAIVALALWVTGGRHCVGWIALGAGAVLFALGSLDWMSYGYPFQSIGMNIYANIIAGVAKYYGQQPIYFYPDMMLHYWGGAFALIGLLGLIGAMRVPLAAGAAAAILLAHSLVGHKEYRFIYPALPLLMVLVGVGSAQVLAVISARGRAATVAVGIGAVLFWSVTSWAVATQGPFRREWQRVAGHIEASRHVAGLADICGIGFYRLDGDAFPRHMGQTHPVAFFTISDEQRFAADAASFNVVIAPDDALPGDARFGPPRCWADGLYDPFSNRRRPHICVMVRAGGCVAGAVSDPNLARPPGW